MDYNPRRIVVRPFPPRRGTSWAQVRKAGRAARPNQVPSLPRCWVESALDGRRPGERLVALYGPTVYGWCRHLGVSEADAADVVQDVFAAVATDIDRFHRDRPGDSFGAWLRTLTRHRVTDHHRRRQGQPDALGGTDAYGRLLDVAETPEPSLSPSMEREPLLSRRMLDLVRTDFEPSTWEAFWRIVVDGQSPAEVAEALGLSPAAVYMAKSRVLRRLREELGDFQAG